MEQETVPGTGSAGDGGVRALVRDVVQEFLEIQKTKAEPAYKTELAEERKRREQLERRLNELVEENKRSRARADEAERSAAIRSELQRLGVTKLDLAFRAVKDEVLRAEDGRLVVRGAQGETGLREHLVNFVNENPELLPARMVGGSGTSAGQRTNAGPSSSGGVDLDRIKPGMDPEEMERVRQEIARIASQTLHGA